MAVNSDLVLPNDESNIRSSCIELPEKRGFRKVARRGWWLVKRQISELTCQDCALQTGECSGQAEELNCCDRKKLGEKAREMPASEKDRLAVEAMDRWQDFQLSLSSEKRRYPIQQFRAFWTAATRYADSTKSESLIHKNLAAAVNGLVNSLRAERKRVPGDILRDADRLEYLFFGGYDPHFSGDEPPGL